MSQDRGQGQAASASVEAGNDKALRTLPFDDNQDFVDAERGFVAALALVGLPSD